MPPLSPLFDERRDFLEILEDYVERRYPAPGRDARVEEPVETGSAAKPGLGLLKDKRFLLPTILLSVLWITQTIGRPNRSKVGVALAAKLGLDLQQVYEVITRSAGNSWMFENRGPRLVEGDSRPRSAIEIFVKDLGIVVDTAREQRFPVPLAANALQQFLAAAGSGLGQLDDSTVARVYARLSGVTLPGMEE